MDKSDILSKCASLAQKGRVFHVNRYKYSTREIRKKCIELNRERKLKQLPQSGRLLRFFRPEDSDLLEKARVEMQEDMRKIYRNNCRTMIEWARKHKDKGDAVDHYIERFWEYKHLSWNYIHSI